MGECRIEWEEWGEYEEWCTGCVKESNAMRQEGKREEKRGREGSRHSL